MPFEATELVTADVYQLMFILSTELMPTVVEDDPAGIFVFEFRIGNRYLAEPLRVAIGAQRMATAGRVKRNP